MGAKRHDVAGRSGGRSPYGSRIAFVRVVWRAPEGWPAASALYVARADGSGEVRLAGGAPGG